MEANNKNQKPNKSGSLYLGSKDLEYLQKVSREAVESHHNMTIMYFEIDVAKSHRNFYGELLYKKFVNDKGIEIPGTIKFESGDEDTFQGLPNKISKLVFSTFTDTLKEYGINPKLGDYFSYGKRFYLIYDKTLNQVGVENIVGDRKQVRMDFKAVQDDEEVLYKDPYNHAFEGAQTDILNNGSIGNPTPTNP